MHRDYLLTMIEKLGELVRQVMKRGDSPEQTQVRIDELANELTGLPATTVCTLPPAEVYRLIAGSDRMVAEKSYAVAELSRVQGLLASDPAERQSLFRRALFFYEHCGPELEDELGETLAERQAELKATLDGAPAMESEERQHLVPPETPPPARRQPKPGISWLSRLSLAVMAVSLVAILFQPAPDYQITDTTWRKQGPELLVTSVLRNRSDDARQLTVEFLADYAHTAQLDQTLSFAGRLEQSFHLAPASELPIEVRVPLTRSGGEVLLTAQIIRVE